MFFFWLENKIYWSVFEDGGLINWLILVVRCYTITSILPRGGKKRKLLKHPNSQISIEPLPPFIWH